MKIISGILTLEEIKRMAEQRFGNLSKAVVDVKRGIMAIDAELHADAEAALLEDGSQAQNLWGINIYPEMPQDEWIEFDSLINLRPSEGNRTRGVDNPKIRQKIIEIVNRLVRR